MKLLSSLVIVLHFVVCSGSNAEDLSTVDILKWPRMEADKFGCYLEREFGFKDEKFNCQSKKYVNSGDPCDNTEAYYEGPSFPKVKAKAVNPLIEDIQLEWEHGDLRSVSVQFTRSISKEEIIKTFNLPAKFDYPKEHTNITSISIEECSKMGNCLSIQGFDHMGAADVDCSR